MINPNCFKSGAVYNGQHRAENDCDTCAVERECKNPYGMFRPDVRERTLIDEACDEYDRRLARRALYVLVVVLSGLFLAAAAFFYYGTHL